jgi:hypothetical protein
LAGGEAIMKQQGLSTWLAIAGLVLSVGTVSAGDFQGCPSEGIQTDPTRAAKPKLNTLKNREETPPTYKDMSFHAFLGWTDAVGAEGEPNEDISDETLAKVQPLIDKAVRIHGYLVGAKKGSRESANCGGSAGYDFHLWLSDEPGEDQDKISNEELRGYKATAIVIEPTPRWKEKHPNWKSLAKFKHLIAQKTKVRISGWVFFDPEHPNEVEQTRATLWEIHPVTKIEYWQAGHWHPL